MAWPTAISALDGFEGVDTDGETLREFQVEADTIWAFVSQGNQSMLDDAWFVPDVMRNPVGIWKGLGRAGQSDSFCYAGDPTGNFADSFGMTYHLQESRIFLVFLNQDLTIAKWRWDIKDSDNSGFPTNHRIRFGERLWPLQ